MKKYEKTGEIAQTKLLQRIAGDICSCSFCHVSTDWHRHPIFIVKYSQVKGFVCTEYHRSSR